MKIIVNGFPIPLGGKTASLKGHGEKFSQGMIISESEYILARIECLHCKRGFWIIMYVSMEIEVREFVLVEELRPVGEDS